MGNPKKIDERPHPDRRHPWLLYFAAANAMLAALISASIVPPDQWFASPGAGIFLLLALPGHFFFLALVIYFPLRLVARLCRNESATMAIAALLFASFVLVVLINARVFELYRFHLNGMVLNLLSGAESLQILAIPASSWALLLAVFGVLVALQSWLARALRSLPSDRRRGPRRLWLLALLVMLSGQFYYAYSDARGEQRVTAMLRYIPWAQPLTARRALRKLGVRVARADDLPGLALSARSALAYPRNPLHCDPAGADGYNTVLIVVDSLRFDMLDDTVMPNASRLARESLVFADHYSTGNATRFGIFGLLYGLPGNYWYPMLGERRGSVLLDVLLRQNQQLFFHAAASWSSPEFDRTALVTIADQTVSGKQLQAANPQDRRHRDSLVTDDFLRRIRERDQSRSFFGLLFLDAPHSFTRDASAPAPFQPAATAPDYLALDADYEPTEFLNLYRNAVFYDDLLIGQVLAALRELALLESTIVILTSDHGQEFNDTRENYWGHNSNFSPYQTRVPLVIRWPDAISAKIGHRTSHVDLVPTLMRRNLGCGNPVDDYSTGQDLFAETYRPRPLLVESWSRRAIVSFDRIYTFESFGGTQVRDLEFAPVAAEPVDGELLAESLEVMRAFLQ